MKKYLLPKDGNYYKANMHVHTNISDGRMTPEQVKEIYKSHGYSIISITDHQIMLPHPELNDENFLTITGTEFAKNMGAYMLLPSTHINIYAKDPNACTYPYFNPNNFWKGIDHATQYFNDEMRNYTALPFCYAPESLNQLIEACNDNGYLVCYNHPKGSLQNYSFYGSLKGLWGVECFNSGCYSAQYYEDMTVSDDLYRNGERRAFPIAADDAHDPETCCHGYIMLNAEKLEYSCVMESLEKGNFYASTGIEIKELYVEDNNLHIEVDGADEIVLLTPIRFRKGIKSEGTPITSWDCDITKLISMYKENYDSCITKNTYFRIEVKRKDGAVAYTKAYFLDTDI